jgi:hypothetical protein
MVNEQGQIYLMVSYWQKLGKLGDIQTAARVAELKKRSRKNVRDVKTHTLMVE